MERYEVMMGGSGRWVAREVIKLYPNGRVAEYGKAYWEHSPKGIEVVLRQLERQIRGEKPRMAQHGLGGGHIYHVVRVNGKLEEKWDWDE